MLCPKAESNPDAVKLSTQFTTTDRPASHYSIEIFAKRGKIRCMIFNLEETKHLGADDKIIWRAFGGSNWDVYDRKGVI